MNWPAVIDSLEATVRGAEFSAKIADRPEEKLEARIVSGIAAALAVALRNGLEGDHP